MRAFHWKNNQKYLVSFSKPNSVCCKFVYLAHCLYFQCAELCLPSCTWLRFIKTIDERIKRKQRKPFQNQNETKRNKQRKLILLEFSSFQFSCCRVQLFATQWTAACQASLSITSSWAFSNSCPLSRWCHSTISSFVVPFFSWLQSFPESGAFPLSQFFTSGG